MAAFAKLALEQAECRAQAQEKAAYEAGMAQIVAGGQSIRNPLLVARAKTVGRQARRST
jgi:hypothetical protein